MRPRQRKYRVKAYQAAALQLLRPPEQITVSQWAERERIMDERSCAIPGPWRNSVTPYLVEIMDALNDYEVEEVIFVKPTQVGGTETLQNMLGYIIAQDPAPTMLVYPTDKLAESLSENRLIPMIRSSQSLASRFYERGTSKLEIQFTNMYVSLCGANSPSSLASKPIRFLLLDEVDKYPAASKKEADPISLARERTKTFHNRKIYMCSTPTLRTGHIWKAKEGAHVEKHYFVPCPHCGEYIELKFAQIKWPDKSEGLSNADRADQAIYVCQECGAVITDANKQTMLKQGRWQVVRDSGRSRSKVAFVLNTLYSPFVRFSQIAKEFLDSKDDNDKLQNFVNSWLAEPWEATKLKTDAEMVMARQANLPEFILPPWTQILTAGVDVQESCLYWTIRAWGSGITSQNIAHGQALCFEEIANIMDTEYRYEDGTPRLVDLCLIDSGDQTEDVYDFCATHSEWALPVKGSSKPMLSHYRLSTINKAGSKAFGTTLVLVDGSQYKDAINSRMSRANGKGSWMVYKGCDREYAEQVTAEHKVTERNGSRESQVWVKKGSHADNHYLDSEVYCFAAADIRGVRALFLHDQVEEKPPAPQATPPTTSEEEWIKANDHWI